MRSSTILAGQVFFCLITASSGAAISLSIETDHVGQYERIEMTISVNRTYKNPVDPEEAELSIRIDTPEGKSITLPAFWTQEYETRPAAAGSNRIWRYPKGMGVWKARFAPMQIGTYQVRAILKDQTGNDTSNQVIFQCTPSENRGFVRVHKLDPHFFAFGNGDFFFPIGQNLAFIGEGQYVTVSRARTIFERLHENGANFVRIWTCCEDWAMAIEARKSAWDRSWSRRKDLLVAHPDNPGQTCVRLTTGSLNVDPTHPVPLRPNTTYTLTGRFRNNTSGLRIMLEGNEWRIEPDKLGQWTSFEKTYTTGPNQIWMGRMSVAAEDGEGLLDGLTLTETGGGPNLLWEADVNRPSRGVYNQTDCQMLDEVLEAAKENRIYLMLCLLTRDLYMDSLKDPQSNEYSRAIEDAKKILRYAIARWGCLTNVAAWEYFNEQNPNLPTDRFYTELGQYLEQIDPYTHLRTTSTWHPSARDCRLAQIDIAQLHHYMRPGDMDGFRDEAAVLQDRGYWLQVNGPGKLGLIGEFGLATDKWGLSDFMKQDLQGVHFHNTLWASTFSGASGTAMLWWWDQLDRQDLYAQYRPLSEFLEDVSFVGMQPVQTDISGGSLHVLGYQDKTSAILWIFDPQAVWWNQIVDKKKPTVVATATLEIRKLDSGVYHLQWFDTHKGETVLEQTVKTTETVLRMSIPLFTGDIACKAFKNR
ncbi:MAG: DUF5060 domain-containing protein [Sedimentisphaerales bacterium]|nr:DUF5060 domain-containing protein [Sedimentisphaerales bacterium]